MNKPPARPVRRWHHPVLGRRHRRVAGRNSIWLRLAGTSALPRPDWNVLRDLGRTALAHNWLNLAITVPRALIPVLVTVIVSPAANAAFYAAWTLSGFLYIVPTHLSTSLFAVAAADPESIAGKLRVTLRLSFLVGLPGMAVLALAGHTALGLFGPGYARAGTLPLLLLLVVGYLPTVPKVQYIAVCRALGRIPRAAAVLTAAAAAELTAAAIGGTESGLKGLSIALLAVFLAEGLVTAPAVIRAAIGNDRHQGSDSRLSTGGRDAAKWLRRHMAVTAVSASVILVAAVTGYSSWPSNASAPGQTARSAPATPGQPARSMPYLGVYERTSPNSYADVARFARAVGRQPNIVLYYSNWGDPFATAFARTAASHGALTLVQIDPYGVDLAQLAAGAYDSYLTSFADQVAAFGHPVVIGFGYEMNGFWYSWGFGRTDPAVFVAAWRHVVTVFRDHGAGNVKWLWTINRTSALTPIVRDWWPGSRYVDWVGVDGYYYRPNTRIAPIPIHRERPVTGHEDLVTHSARSSNP